MDIIISVADAKFLAVTPELKRIFNYSELVDDGNGGLISNDVPLEDHMATEIKNIIRQKINELRYADGIKSASESLKESEIKNL